MENDDNFLPPKLKSFNVDNQHLVIGASMQISPQGKLLIKGSNGYDDVIAIFSEFSYVIATEKE